jgi:hypothetical protein
MRNSLPRTRSRSLYALKAATPAFLVIDIRIYFCMIVHGDTDVVGRNEPVLTDSWSEKVSANNAVGTSRSNRIVITPRMNFLGFPEAPSFPTQPLVNP